MTTPKDLEGLGLTGAQASRVLKLYEVALAFLTREAEKEKYTRQEVVTACLVLNGVCATAALSAINNGSTQISEADKQESDASRKQIRDILLGSMKVSSQTNPIILFLRNMSTLSFDEAQILSCMMQVATSSPMGTKAEEEEGDNNSSAGSEGSLLN